MECLICKERCEQFEHFYRCNSCGFYFKEPQLFEDLSSQKRRYDHHQNNSDDPRYKAYFEKILSPLEPLISHAKRALDFGSGKSDLLATLLEQRGINTIAYDPIYRAVEYNNKRYDFIISVEVFEHLHEPKKVFKMLRGLLKEEGVLAIRSEFPPSDKEDFKKWYYHLDPTHICFFSKKSFELLAKEADLTVCYCNEKNLIAFQSSSSNSE